MQLAWLIILHLSLKKTFMLRVKTNVCTALLFIKTFLWELAYEAIFYLHVTEHCLQWHSLETHATSWRGVCRFILYCWPFIGKKAFRNSSVLSWDDCLFKYENLSLCNVSKAKVVPPQEHLNCINIHNSLSTWSQRNTVMSNGISVSHGICLVDTMFK